MRRQRADTSDHGSTATFCVTCPQIDSHLKVLTGANLRGQNGGQTDGDGGGCGLDGGGGTAECVFSPHGAVGRVCKCTVCKSKWDLLP